MWIVALPPAHAPTLALLMWPIRVFGILRIVLLWKLPSRVTSHVSVLPALATN